MLTTILPTFALLAMRACAAAMSANGWTESTTGRIAPVERLHGWWAEAIAARRPMVPGLLEALSSQRCCDQARENQR